MGEDCLVASLWTPSLDSRASLPVIVILHGGAFKAGGVGVHGTEEIGVPLAAAGTGHVVVAFHYRLGALGMSSHPALEAANWGHLDQVAAMRWINQEATAFGGSPSNILLYGYSAGAISAVSLLASPMSQGLFRAAFLSSTYSRFVATLDEAREAGTQCALATGCASDDAEEELFCLRGLDAGVIVANCGAPSDPAGFAHGA